MGFLARGFRFGFFSGGLTFNAARRASSNLRGIASLPLRGGLEGSSLSPAIWKGGYRRLERAPNLKAARASVKGPSIFERSGELAPNALLDSRVWIGKR